MKARTFLSISTFITLLTCYIIAEEEKIMATTVSVPSNGATLNGKTPAQIAHDIVTDAVESVMVEISGTASQRLETVVRYLNRDKISARGETWFRKNHDSLTTDAIETLVTAREKAITDYQNKKELMAKDELFRTLVARGIPVAQAEKEAYH